MKIAVLSDFHLGAKQRSPREQDPLIQAREAFEKAVQENVQLILISGDIFNQRTPSQELWAKAMRILNLPSSKDESRVELLEVLGKDEEEISPLALRGIPVIAVHGNHERRGVGLVDPVEALEAAGLVIRLNQNTILLKTPEGKVAIHGMGFVPEEEARNVMELWNPKPIKGAYNVLMIHQSLGQYTYSEDEKPVLVPSDLPEGFDLYISGHVHYQADTKIYGKPLLFPGSTFRTQLLPIEAEVPKGFFIINTGGDPTYRFIELDSVCDFFYEEKEFDGVTIRQIEDWITRKMREILEKPRKNKDKRPLVRFRLRGELAKGNTKDELIAADLVDKFVNDSILHISKRELASPDLEEQTQLLQDLRERKIPLEEMTMNILKSKLEEVKYDRLFEIDSLYELLSEGMEDEALRRISETIDQLTETELEGKA
ncbi:hypothetical protein AKJ35_00020 [candidate division MSBL1 archaeon SCGC-AAA833F18]|uniref:Calcineurin-like phosphoesterase domain-containing protein n=2 Tax=candidate division MSBL1 TaxID=215777 RepID=A0A133VS62_9EURY|nr:hypothetical protein AKJ46_00645 [candidate division MSBL1 archaeon SCGC-AAA833K04]KXB09642.1 hypothetical protein AKJ35_00020 [candidate division MSBL1 archaeon SCGC-AAA833F18]